MIPKRVRWMAIGVAVNYATRRKVQRDVSRAAERFDTGMPTPLARVVSALPGDLARVGGTAIVVGHGANRAARGAVVTTRAVGRLGRRSGAIVRTSADGVAAFERRRRSLDARLRSARGELDHEIEQERRRLKSEAVREAEGDAAALEALLDLRTTDSAPLPTVPDPIAEGRRRHRVPLPPAPVARVQRTYQRPVESWNRRPRTWLRHQDERQP